jgi:hypothetical protein
MWGAALLHGIEKEQEPEHRSEAVEFCMAAMEEMVNLLVEFDRSSGGGVSVHQRIQRVERGVAQSVEHSYPEIAEKMRDWLTVLGAANRGESEGGHRYERETQQMHSSLNQKLDSLTSILHSQYRQQQ